LTYGMNFLPHTLQEDMIGRNTSAFNYNMLNSIIN